MSRFGVELLGFPNTAREQAATSLAEVFGISADQAAQVVGRAPVVIKSVATIVEAQEFVGALERIGGQVRVLDKVTGAPIEVRPPAAPDPPPPAPAGPAEIAARAAGRGDERCAACETPLNHATMCKRCGWDKTSGRRCLKCNGLILPLSSIRFGMMGGAGVGVFAVAALLFGIVGPLAAGFLGCAVVSVMIAGTLRLRCQECRTDASERFLILGEREELASKRQELWIRACLIAVGAIGAIVLWFMVILGGAMIMGSLTFYVIIPLYGILGKVWHSTFMKQP